MSHPTSVFMYHCREWQFSRRDRDGYAWLTRDGAKVCRPHVAYRFGAFEYTINNRVFGSIRDLCDAYATVTV